MKLTNFLLVMAVVVLQDCHRGEVRQEAAQPAQKVRLKPVVKGNLAVAVVSNGVLSSSEEIKLSFKTGGIVASVRVQEGEKVKKGQVLALLNLSEIEANKRLAAIALEKAKRDFERAGNLFRDSVATLEQKQNAASALDAARSNYEIAEFNLAHSTIAAPGNGVILRQLVRANELAGPGMPVFLFGLTGRQWKVRTGLSDRDVVRVAEGDSAAVSFDAWPGVSFSARVEQSAGMASPSTGTFETTLLLDETAYSLVAGMVCRARIFPSVHTECSFVPVESLLGADGSSGFVYAVTDDGRAQKISVEILSISGNEISVRGIPGTVSAVIADGAPYVRDGMKVEVLK